MPYFDPADFTITTDGDGRRMISMVGGGGSAMPWYNVKDYGATGDGVTDDYAAFIACRDAIWLAGIAAVFYVPAGTYLLSSYVQLQSAANRPPMYVLGDWATIKPTTDTSVFYRKWDDTGAFGDVVQLVIDGIFFEAGTPAAGIGVHTADSWGTIVRRCHFKNLRIGIHVQSVNSWNEGWVSEDNIFDACTDGMYFDAPGGTGSFQSGRFVNTAIRSNAAQHGIKIVNGANMYGSHFELQLWPGGNNAIGIDIDGNIDSCKFSGIVDNAGGGGTPLFGMRFGTNATNTDKAQFSMDFAGTYTGGDAQENAVSNAFGKTWYYDPLPYGSRLYPRFTLLTTTGDTPYASAANTWARRAIGSAGDLYKVAGGVPTWAAPAALTKVDDTNVTATLGGAATTALVNAASITLGWTGQLAVSRGGIGVGTLASNGVLYGNGTGAVLALAVNATATNKYLRQVSSGAPSWETIPASEITSGAALTKVDDTNVTATLGGTPASALLVAASITLGWTGQLSIARGGTGAATALAAFNALSPLTTRGDLLTRDATNNVRLAIGTVGRYLGTDGTDPIWTAPGALTKADDTNVTLTLGGTPATALLLAVSLTLGWTGTLAQSRGGTGSATPFANPSASVGLAAVNGAATTFMRSDAAPALSQSITPTWTGLHIWSAVPVRIQGAGGYFSVGVTGAPANTTAGDGTLSRLFIGDLVADGAAPIFQLNTGVARVPTTSEAVHIVQLWEPATAGATSSVWRLAGTVNPTAANGSGSHYGINLEMRHSSGNFAIGSIIGVAANLYPQGASATIASAIAVQAGITSSSATTTLAKGIEVTIDGSGGGPITTGIGIDIVRASMTTGIGLRIQAASGLTTDIAIQSLGGANRFVGAVVVGANAAITSGYGLDVQGVRSRLNTTATLTGSLDSAVILGGTITNNTTANIGGLHLAYTFDGNATDPFGLLSRCFFTPSASIADAQGGYINAIGNPASGKTITNLYGHRSSTASLSGAGAITNAVSIYADVYILSGGVTPTNVISLKIASAAQGTNNYDMQFVTFDSTAAGTYYSRVPVLVNGLKKYLHLFNA